jgi:tetratricopeptide (TPR) repeat protein
MAELLVQIQADNAEILRRLTPQPENETTRPPGAMSPNNLPHKRNPYFIGRISIFDRIQGNFQNNGKVSLTQSIAGLGGVGKSSIALEYAYRHEDEYDIIWWVNAANEQTAINDLTQFAVERGLIPSNEIAEHNIVLRIAQKWLNENDKWLFIYDNADADDFDKWLEQYLPQSSLGHVIITTRSRYFPQSEQVDIDLFTEYEAVEFLKTRTKKEGGEFSDEWAKELAYSLGYFPLALEQAAAYICVTPTMTYEKYIAEVEKYLEKAKNLTHYDKTVYATLQISIEKIPEDSAARQMFNMCAYFAPDRIPIDIFVRGSEALPETLKASIADIDDIVGELAKYSLLKYEDSGLLSIHRLVQQSARRSFADDTEWLECCLALICQVANWEGGDKYSIDAFKAEITHVITITEKAEGFFTDEARLFIIGWLFNKIGATYCDLGGYAQTLKYCNRALEKYRNIYNDDHPHIADIYVNIGAAYQRTGAYVQALEYFNRTVAINIRKSLWY